MAHRCHVCDRTDDKRLIIHDEQYFKGPYVKDNRYGGKDICDTCSDAIQETLYDEVFDEPVSPFRNY